jgi:hypothetical protein
VIGMYECLLYKIMLKTLKCITLRCCVGLPCGGVASSVVVLSCFSGRCKVELVYNPVQVFAFCATVIYRRALVCFSCFCFFFGWPCCAEMRHGTSQRVVMSFGVFAQARTVQPEKQQ